MPLSAVLRRASAPERMIRGTCGPTYFDSSASAGLGSSWANRLAERLATVGSTEFALIWREKVTPAGALISRLAQWTPPISEAGFIGSPQTAVWPTPKESDHRPGMPNRWKGDASQGGRRSNLNDAMTSIAVAGWSTPLASDTKKMSPNEPDCGHGGTPLPAQMNRAVWATPMARDGKGAPHTLATMATNSRPLNEQMSVTARMAAFGLEPNGSPATTKKRGVPNPAHPCWLMGYPAEWLCGGGSGTPSTRSSPPK